MPLDNRQELNGPRRSHPKDIPIAQGSGAGISRENPSSTSNLISFTGGNLGFKEH